MKFIFTYLKNYKKQLIVLMILYAFATLASLFMPFIMSNIVNYGIAEQNLTYIIVQGAIMFALALLAVVLAVICVKINSKVASGFCGDLFKGIFEKTNSLSMDEFLKLGTSSLLTRSTRDVHILYEFGSHLAFIVVNIPILFIGGIILTSINDLTLALILFASAPVIIFLVWLITKRMVMLWEKADKHIDDQNKIVRERLTGIRVIRAFDREDYEHERMSQATKKMATNLIKANIISGSVMPSVMLLFNIAIVLVLYIGSYRLTNNPMLNAGDIIATVQYATLVMFGCSILTFGLIFLPQLKVSAERINEVLTTKGDPIITTKAEKLSGDITFDNVNFFYPGSAAPALENISLEIKSGETVAIIGGTGSGKTTLTRLMLLLHHASSGTITLGGKSYSEITRETARDNISIVLQKGMIFQTSIKDNIKFGNLDCSDEEMEKAAEIAQLSSYVDSLAEKYEHKLSQSGSNISGGQKQRINIARALVKKASVYIFDDSFSNLDFITEAKLRKALKTELKGKTQIVITQRAATAMHCDRIFVMDNGKLEEVGTHKQLLKSSKIYREIVKSQMG